MTASQMADTIKAEVISLVESGTIPADVPDFPTLHDYCDANCLGSTEAYLDTLAEGEFHDGIALIDESQTLVDGWIKSGGLQAVSA